jgi:hypothetical protein
MMPTFVFIDPFGFKIPFAHVAKVLQAQSCEVLSPTVCRRPNPEYAKASPASKSGHDDVN